MAATSTFESTLAEPAAGGADSRPSAMRWQSALAAIGRRAVAAPDVVLLMQDAGTLLAEMLSADWSSVAEVSEDGKAISVRLSEVSGSAPLTFEQTTDEHGGLAAFALHSGHPLVLPDLATESRVKDGRLEREGVRGAIVCPLKLNDQSFGTLGVYARQPRRFAPDDVLFVEAIAHLLTTTIARERTQRELDSQRRFTSTLLHTVEGPVLVLNPAGRLIELNRAAEQMTGFTTQEVYDRPVFNALVVPEEVELMKSVLERLGRGESPVSFESSILTKLGDRRQISWRFSVQKNAQGRASTLVGAGIDVTDQRAAKVEVAEARQAAVEAERRATQLTFDLEQARLAGPAGQGTKPAPRPFERLADPRADRRARPRRSYPYVQRVAPMIAGKMPSSAAFQEVLCRDISASGFSYYSPHPPASDTLVVAFGAGSVLTYVTATIVHCQRDAEAGSYAVGCRYVGRLSS